MKCTDWKRLELALVQFGVPEPRFERCIFEFETARERFDQVLEAV